jgi:hypothetical protein
MKFPLATLNFNRLHFYCHISQIDIRQSLPDENTAEEAKLPKISFVVVNQFYLLNVSPIP